MKTRPRDICPACRLPRRLRKDGRIERHKKPRPSDSGWNWRATQVPGDCPGTGERPLTLTPAKSTEVKP
ncbi:hypothetical protein MED01_004252 [Micromonospora sp. MED01]|uniref:hypothetical protein n=1 Tax=Micromonospora alfalfae TaxID=2911212 RepID=UPI001EE927E8|nr:hypothetical protein [Micromonospora alfalfae]MCG5460826.1 hypothetical protein [Micromonospora alfalfae]